MRIKTKLQTESTVFLLVLAGILLLVNVLGLKLFGRLDLTRDRLHSLSPASLALVDRLDDKLVVKAYFTKNLPGRYASLERHVRDLLDEYRSASHGRLEVTFIDPAGDEAAEKVAADLGIRKMPNPDIEKDQATVKEGYRGLAFSYGQHNEVIPAIESPIGLEYEITTTLKKVVGTKARVGFLAGHGEPEIAPPPEEKRPLLPEEMKQRGAFQTVRNNLEIHDYEQIDLARGAKPVPENIDALVIVGSREKLDDKELFQIDQFLMRGGAVALFLSGVDVEVKPGEMQGLPPTYEARVNESGWRPILEKWGVYLGADLVLDAQASDFVSRCAPIPIPLPRPYPAWPISTAFGEEHALTFRLGSLTLPYPSVVRLTAAARGNKQLEARELVFTSGNAWTLAAAGASLDPCNLTPSTKLESSLPLAAVLKGTFASAFAGRDLPDPAAQATFLAASQAPGRLLVVGSSRFTDDELLSYLARGDRRRALGNFAFVQNGLDYLTSSEDLIAVRMKTVADPPIDQGVSDTTRAAVKWANLVGLPLGFVLFGVFRWRARQRGASKPTR